ncbi:MAG: iron-containing alcohol dehydrogenase, partial [Chloroflexota bacterium]
MDTDIHIQIKSDVVPALIDYVNDNYDLPVTVVCDANTYDALAQRVIEAFDAVKHPTETVLLTGDEIVANGDYLLKLLVGSRDDGQVFLSVGSGTLTDLTRYASFRTRNPFIAVPTAPSVDGFISLGAPLIIDGVKQTQITHPPAAVFADLGTLAAAPSDLIAAGFGDILGKVTSLADWKLAHLLWEEPFDEAVEQRTRRALDRCIAAVDQIAARDEDGIKLLMDALLESGISMFEFGSSRSASG